MTNELARRGLRVGVVGTPQERVPSDSEILLLRRPAQGVKGLAAQIERVWTDAWLAWFRAGYKTSRGCAGRSCQPGKARGGGVS
ncbi:MAG: hypothetical protein HYZ93_00005 [Candidatus Omnitrophica bacterium]|nr:hypothetical protein [Candidatus Omnitrophota bacterium]